MPPEWGKPLNGDMIDITFTSETKHASNPNAKNACKQPECQSHRCSSLRGTQELVDERSPILPEGDKKTSEGFPYPGAPEAIAEVA